MTAPTPEPAPTLHSRWARMQCDDDILLLSGAVEHTVYVAADGQPEECIDECPACAVERIAAWFADRPVPLTVDFVKTVDDLRAVVWDYMSRDEGSDAAVDAVLAAHDAQVRAEARAEGFIAGFEECASGGQVDAEAQNDA